MKICFLIQDFSLGGSTTVVYDLINNWNKDDELFLICFFDDFDERYKKLFERENLRIIFLHKRSTIDFKFLKLFKKTINNISPDVISSHLSCIFYLKLVYSLNKSIIFHTIHNRPKKDLPFIYRLFLMSDIKKKRIHLISCGKSVQLESEQYYKVKVHNIQNGIDLNDQKTSILHNPDVTFLSIGRLTDVKSVDDIVHAFSIAHKVTNKGKLIICGYGPEEDKILNLIQEYRINDFVSIVGKTGDVRPLYESSDVFCLVSEREGSPIVLLEAMKYGLALIGSDVAGTRDLVENDSNGFIVPYKNIEQIANKMILFIENEDLLLKMKKQSSKLVHKYDLKNMVKKYSELFHNIFSERR